MSTICHLSRAGVSRPHGQRVVLRDQTVFDHNYPYLVDALKMLPAKEVIIDGEITALDGKGKASFQLLQSYGSNKEIPVVYYAFDLISLEGTRLRDRPLTGCRKRLAKLLEKSSGQYLISPQRHGSVDEFLRVAHQFQHEGFDHQTAGFNL